MSEGGQKIINYPPVVLIGKALLTIALVLSTTSCNQQQSASSGDVEKTFASPEAAGQALFEAAKAGDENALMSVFGPEAKDLLFSGDAVKDKNAARHFVDAYSQMNRWHKSESGEEVLYIGADNFAFPIPLKQNTSGQWMFDAAAGKDEVLARRIGDGELSAIGVLSEVANAQQEYFSRNHQFAQKFVSDNGQQNGLLPRGNGPVLLVRWLRWPMLSGTAVNRSPSMVITTSY
jgi:hypothetical protein